MLYNGDVRVCTLIIEGEDECTNMDADIYIDKIMQYIHDNHEIGIKATVRLRVNAETGDNIHIEFDVESDNIHFKATLESEIANYINLL